MAGDQPHTQSTVKVEVENGLDGRTKTNIADLIVVEGEEVDDGST